MKQKFIALFTSAVLLLCIVACTDKTEGPISQQEMEKRLIGLWYEEFNYEDVTEEGKPFNRALIAVETKADHTGYVALAVFDDEFNEPLEVYGGPNDAPFTWQVTAEGDVTLTDPNSGSTIISERSRSDEKHSNFVDIGQIEMNCTQSNVTFSNASHKGSLVKANSNKNSLIEDWMAKSTLPQPALPTASLWRFSPTI